MSLCYCVCIEGGECFIIGFWFWAEGNFRVLCFWLFFLAKIFGCFFFLFNNAGF